MEPAPIQEMVILSPGARPPCAASGRVCRGCSGWPAMSRAVRPGGPWAGAAIHCPCTGLTVRAAGEAR
jgi:hypothetical protein